MKPLLGAALAFTALAAVGAAPAAADTYTPTRFDDPVPGSCKPRDCSLREAITKANEHAGADRVVLAAGTYGIEQPETDFSTPDDANKNGDLDVTGEVQILGRGIRRTIVDGNGIPGVLSRVFSFLTSSPKSMEHVTVTDGFSYEGGGGILAGPGKLTLRDVVITRNEAVDEGGGILTLSEDLKLIRVTVRENYASKGGGGIYSTAGTGTVGPQMDVRDSAIWGNATPFVGGGLYLDGLNTPVPVTASVQNSTFANNEAEYGGGIAARHNVSLTLDNSTVAFNKANRDNELGGEGGGLYEDHGATFNVIDSIVQGNRRGSSQPGAQGSHPEDCAGSIKMTYVVLSVGGCHLLEGSVTRQEPGRPNLDPISGNGGPTKTVEVHSGSAAIGYSDDGCPPKDQRGALRPARNCDAGAYERRGP